MMIRKLTACALLLSLFATRVCAADEREVNVLYAGSLVNLMERSIGPAFEKASGLRFIGYAAGSNRIASEINAKLRRGDVFISASPKVNESLVGKAHGNAVSWYIRFASSPLLPGYNPLSRFAADFRAKRWDAVLREPGIRIGRTDPKLDPKGALTIELVTKAAALYHQPDLVRATLGAPENPAQVFPEEALAGRLQSGQLDVGFFYSTELADLKIPAARPAPELKVQADYTVTILNDAPNASGAARFVSFLLSSQGRRLLAAHGMNVTRPVVAGDARAIPPRVRATLNAVP
jgi:molybdate/tungstate transport system substrate-binding protein